VPVSNVTCYRTTGLPVARSLTVTFLICGGSCCLVIAVGVLFGGRWVHSPKCFVGGANSLFDGCDLLVILVQHVLRHLGPVRIVLTSSKWWTSDMRVSSARSRRLTAVIENRCVITPQDVAFVLGGRSQLA